MKSVEKRIPEMLQLFVAYIYWQCLAKAILIIAQTLSSLSWDPSRFSQALAALPVLAKFHINVRLQILTFMIFISKKSCF